MKLFTVRSLCVALAAACLSCSQDDSKGPMGPGSVLPESVTRSNAAAANASATSPEGTSRTSAVGDIKNGPIEILRVRVRPTDAPGFYAEPGGVYRVEPNAPAEFWIEWSSDTPLTNPPRLAIDWDFAESDNIHCGPCLVAKTIPAGLRTVTVRMDDRAGGVTRRTFALLAERVPVEPGPTPAPTPTCPTSTFDGSFEVVTDAWADYNTGDTVPVEHVAGTDEFRIRSTNNPFISNPGTSFMIVTRNPTSGAVSLVSNECFDYGPGFCLNLTGSGTTTCDGRIDLVVNYGGFTGYSLTLQKP